MCAPLLIWRNTVAGAACAACGVRWLVALSACNLNPPQPVPASAASPRAILLPDTPATNMPGKKWQKQKEEDECRPILRPSAGNEGKRRNASVSGLAIQN